MLLELFKKFSIGIVTNAFPSRRLYNLEPLGLTKIIPAENIFLSAEVGYWKPNSKIFEIALERMKANGKTTLFIDDKTKFLRRASEAGIEHLIQRSSDDENNEFKKIKVVTELLDILV